MSAAPANPAQVTGAMAALRAELVKSLDGHTKYSRDCSLSGEFLASQIWPLVSAAIGAGGQAVAGIVPEGCTGKTLVFDPGSLHVNKDGSGYFVVDEGEWQLEDDRCEGPDGPEGSVHWITRLDASEMQALRDFLNGAPRPHPAPSWQAVASLDDVAARLWKADAEDSGTPASVADGRTREAFDDQAEELKARWRKFAKAASDALSQPHPADERVVEALPRPDAVSMTCGTICLEYADRDERDLAFDWLEAHGAGDAKEGQKNG